MFTVSIPQWFDCGQRRKVCQVARICCFNPTMVRLWQRSGRDSEDRGNGFQSHNGSIVAGTLKLACTYSSRRFNPTMVRLWLAWPSLPFQPLLRFNPTMVRLWPSHPPALRIFLLRFNPTMVRLWP